MPAIYRHNATNVTTRPAIAPTAGETLRVTSAIHLARKAWARGLTRSTVYWLECARDSATATGMSNVAGECQVALEAIHAKHRDDMGYVWSGLSAVVEV